MMGHAGGRIRGNLHIVAPEETPMANAWLGVLQKLGVNKDQFGDSTAAIDLNTAPASETTTVREGF